VEFIAEGKKKKLQDTSLSKKGGKEHTLVHDVRRKEKKSSSSSES